MVVGVDSCSLCNDSVITTIKSLMDSGKSLNMASKEVSKEVNEKLGYALYTPASIRLRYVRHTSGKVVRCVQQDQPSENKGEKKRERGSYKEWLRFKELSKSIEAILKEMKELKVDSQNKIPARLLCESLVDKINRLAQKLVG